MWWWVEGHPWLSAAELFETYLVTIGRGNTYILNMPPDMTGTVPEYLYNETAQLGAATRASFSPESAQARLVNQTVECGASAAPLLLPPPAGGVLFDAVMLEEDLALGKVATSALDGGTAAVKQAESTAASARANFLSHWIEFASVIGADPVINQPLTRNDREKR
jgi:hypothetical protein